MKKANIKTEEMINLNRSNLFVSAFDFGRTRLEVRMGRKKFMVKVVKNACDTTIYFYKKLNSDLGKFSMHDDAADLHRVTVANDAMLDRDFFEHIAEIEKAQSIMMRYSYKLA